MKNICFLHICSGPKKNKILFYLGGGLLDLITNQVSLDLIQQFEKGKTKTTFDPFSWDIIGKNLSFLGAEILIFFFVNIIYEVIKDFGRSSNPSTQDVLVLKNVSKTYSTCTTEFDAVKNLNLTVGPHECIGLIGLNGAGKSTTFKMITGQLECTNGTIEFGCDRIGYCPQSNSIDDYITVEDHLWIYSRIAGYNLEESVRVTSELVKGFCLEPYMKVSCGHLSGGNKRKVCTATSLLGRPDLILMDEPTSGMDPSTRRLVWRNIENAVKQGIQKILKIVQNNDYSGIINNSEG